jgi:hypothetical protein
VHVDELYDDSEPEDPSWASPYVDGAWGRTANPNTADVVWLILIGTAIAIIEGVVGIISTW